MHKRADTIGCVWLAYCINSRVIYFCRSWLDLHQHTGNIPADECRPRSLFAPHDHISHRASLSFTLHGTSRLSEPSTKKKGGVKMKNIILPHIVYHVYFCLSSSRAITVHILLLFPNSHS